MLTKKVPLSEKIAFALPSVALSFSLQMVGFYLMFFYTDVFKLPLYAIPIVLLITRTIDAVDDYLVGYFFAVMPRSHHGIYRPYIFWSAIPLAIASVLIFTAPGFSDFWKIVYAIVIYMIWDVINSVLLVASNSLLPVITNDQDERAKINSFRIFLSILAVLLVSSCTLHLVQFFGGESQKRGFFLTALGFSVIGVVLQFYSYYFIKERYNIEESHNDTADKKSTHFGLLWIIREKSLMLLLCVEALFWVSCTFRQQVGVFYFIHVLRKPEYFFLFIFAGIFTSLITQPLIHRLIRLARPEVVHCVGLLGSFFSLLVMWGAGNSIALLIMGNVLFGFMSALPANLIFILIAKHVDLFFKKYKQSLSSWVYALLKCSAKIGIGTGSLTVAVVFWFVGYDPDLELTETAISGIRFCFFGGTTIAIFLAFLVMSYYVLFCEEKSQTRQDKLAR